MLMANSSETRLDSPATGTAPGVPNGAPPAGAPVKLTVPEGEVIRERCKAMGIEWLEKAPKAEPEAVGLIPSEVAVRLRAIPFKIANGRLHVAMREPLDIPAVDELAVLAGRPDPPVGVVRPVARVLMP